MTWCILSSAVFITNCIGAHLHGEYIYSGLWGGLCMSSLLFHSLRVYTDIHFVDATLLQSNEWTHLLLYIFFVIDKIILYLVVLSGFCIICKKRIGLRHTVQDVICCFFIGSTFLLTILLYYYGYIRNLFSFHPNREIADKWHSIVHYIGSFGHHCILLL
jgi:hypothetical protein